MVVDVNGLRIEKGDTVAPINGDFKGRVCAIKLEDGEGYVSIRASHRPYSKGVWYASDHVQRLAIAPDRREAAPKLFDGATFTKPASDGDADTEPTAPSKPATPTRTRPKKTVSKKKATTKPKSPASKGRKTRKKATKAK